MTNLVSNQNAIGANLADPALVNAWGVTSTATSPFWVSDNGTGKSTLYNSVGQKQGLVVTIPAAGGGAGLGLPTGVIANTTTASFVVSVTSGGVTKSAKSVFLFATQDGAIEGWSPSVLPATAVIGADRSALGASYTGLTIFTNSKGASFLYVPNNTKGGGIDIFGGSFNFIESYKDPNIPRDYAPYGIRVINDQLWVTFNSTKKANGGFVDVFRIEDDGTLVELFEANGVHSHGAWPCAFRFRRIQRAPY